MYKGRSMLLTLKVICKYVFLYNKKWMNIDVTPFFIIVLFYFTKNKK